MGNVLRNVLALLIAVGLLAAPFGIIRLAYEIGYIGDRPQIEQLRTDLQGVDHVRSISLIGQATEWNQTIRRMQAYNETWWGRPFIPDQWDDVELLVIPKEPELGSLDGVTPAMLLAAPPPMPPEQAPLEAPLPIPPPP